MLQPRKFKYKSRQKGRTTTRFVEPKMLYGTFGLVLLRPFRISAKKIFRLKLFLKRSARKADWTRRAFWISIFPHLPLSRKAKGVRMGKGAGKLASWYTQIRGGKVLVEFKNLRLGRAIYFSKQVAHKLPVSTTVFSKQTKNVKIVGGSKTNPTLQTFW
jgi:large subunit ribosomal protein L16